MKYSYYPGCTLSTKAKRLDDFARKSAAALGFELIELEKWQCCGAVYPLGTDEVASKLPAVRALAAAHRLGTPLVTLCAACHHVLKRVNDDMKNDAEVRKIVHSYAAIEGENADDDADIGEYAGECEVIHFMEAVARVGFDVVKQKAVNPLKGRKIGAYYGCMLLRPSPVMQFDDPENPSIFEDMLAALGATPIKYAMRNECCGGYISLKEKEHAASQSQKIIDDAAHGGADELITACPLCQYNVNKSAEGLEIKYFTEVLAEALGVGEGADA